jgi:hypothetical protein
MIKWIKALFMCEHKWDIVHSTTTFHNKKVGGGTVMTTAKQVVRECSKCGAKRKES